MRGWAKLHKAKLGLAVAGLALVLLAGCGGTSPTGFVDPSPLHPNETPELRQQIEAAAAKHEVPVSLVQRVVIRESTHRPWARNGPYYGLMQILPQTAATMGYRGPPSGLLDAETNLEYAVRYLKGAWLVADGDQDDAVKWYSRGYYYEAKRKGLLEETGLR
ncbi:lytic transglycosylase domain-containing protein [Meridianimarinicoccus aquatilis]|uniref:Lytic transglycosylase domain-containing protein n=1 Tax=Meridianimarinicoccus aquatilis TaxID=2552766 RepID=A0A4V3BC04_9RHOB|nr:lytic transglycosylase domain-containing protein [Fluviibacterium aquatile]TDL88979.1 lytic transglycosylase domain-containing protein [Fluviibacterium aquatile]